MGLRERMVLWKSSLLRLILRVGLNLWLIGKGFERPELRLAINIWVFNGRFNGHLWGVSSRDVASLLLLGNESLSRDNMRQLLPWNVWNIGVVGWRMNVRVGWYGGCAAWVGNGLFGALKVNKVH